MVTGKAAESLLMKCKRQTEGANWKWLKALTPRTSPQWHISSSKTITLQSQNNDTKWGPRIQIYEPQEDILIQVTTGIMYNTHQ